MDGGFLHELQRAHHALRQHGLPPLDFLISRSPWPEMGAGAFQISVQRRGGTTHAYCMTSELDWIDELNRDLRSALYAAPAAFDLERPLST
ncbi:hypothetical protein BH10PSE17_BH10PSE17_28950 [soil metagenome]